MNNASSVGILSSAPRTFGQDCSSRLTDFDAERKRVIA